MKKNKRGRKRRLRGWLCYKKKKNREGKEGGNKEETKTKRSKREVEVSFREGLCFRKQGTEEVKGSL